MSLESKSSLRRQLKAIAPNQAASIRICGSLERWPQWNGAGVIMGFMALPSEPDILPALRQAFARGAKVAFPIVDGQTIHVGAVASLQEDHFTVDAMGVKCPNAWTPLDADLLELVLVPGVAFDARGARLGRGGGFYDRFLARLPQSAITVGVFDARRMVERVPVEAHDFRVKWLVNDEQGVVQSRPASPL